MSKKALTFGKMFGSGFKEGLTRAATLPDDSIDAFAVFAKWLYLSIEVDSSFISGCLFSKDQTSEERWKVVETIVFADKYGLDELSDLAISSWITWQSSILPLGELQSITSYIIANTSRLCKARAYFARKWAWEILQHPDKDSYKASTPDLGAFINDSDFVEQVFYEMSRLARKKGFDGMWKELPLCDYHHHDKEICSAGYFQYMDRSDEEVYQKPAKKRKSTRKRA